MQRINTILILFGITFVLFSCGDDFDKFDPLTTLYQSSLTRVFDAQGGVEEVFEFNSVEEQVLRFANNSLIDIPADAFISAPGSVYKGEVRLAIKKLENNFDFLSHRKMSVVEGMIVSFQGMFYLEALDQNEEALMLDSDKEIQVRLSEMDRNENAELFYGVQDLNFKWMQADGGATNPDDIIFDEWNEEISTNVFVEGEGYKFFVDRLGWMGAGYFINEAGIELTSFCINADSRFAEQNTRVFLSLDEYDSVIELHYDQQGYCSTSIPLGQSGKFAIISEQSYDEYFFTTGTVDFGENEVLVTQPSEASKDDILSTLEDF